MPGGRANDEYERARAALLAAGFKNSAVVELLTKRYEIRDRFAMAALTGMLAHESLPAGEASADAYMYADNMLDARIAKGEYDDE